MVDYIYLVQGNSESGDNYTAAFWKKPTKEDLTKLVKEWDFGEGDGPGYEGSYVHVDVSKVALR